MSGAAPPWLPPDAEMTVRLAETIAKIVQVRNLIDSVAMVEANLEEYREALTADLRELRQRGATADLAFLERVLAAMDLEFSTAVVEG